MAELDKACTTVVVKCEPEYKTVSIDFGEEKACPVAVYYLSPGPHLVIGKTRADVMNAFEVIAWMGEVTLYDL